METITSRSENVSQPEEQGGDEATRIKNIVLDILQKENINHAGLEESGDNPKIIEIRIIDNKKDPELIEAGRMIKEKLRQEGIERSLFFVRANRKLFIP